MLIAEIESILFVASKPLSFKVLAKAIGVSESDVREAIEQLQQKYNRDNSGIHIIENDEKVQMATNPENTEIVEGFVKDEIAGELTRAQLETLTVIAYRSPITRPELEQIRGVNCAVILRILMIRGLVECREDETKMMSVYTLSFDALRHLGIKSINELPEYEALSRHEYIENVLENTEE